MGREPDSSSIFFDVFCGSLFVFISLSFYLFLKFLLLLSLFFFSFHFLSQFVRPSVGLRLTSQSGCQSDSLCLSVCLFPSLSSISIHIYLSIAISLSPPSSLSISFFHSLVHLLLYMYFVHRPMRILTHLRESMCMRSFLNVYICLSSVYEYIQIHS